MGAGIRVAPVGGVQIDETYKNLVLVEKRAIALQYNVNPTFQVDIAGQYAVFAYSCNVCRPYVQASHFDGAVWHYLFGSVWPTSHLGGTNDVMQLYIFNVPTSPPTTFGAKVFNAVGELTYQTSEKPMKFAAIRNCDTGFTGSPEKQYAVCILEGSYMVRYTGTQYLREYFFPVPNGNSITPDLRDISFVNVSPSAVGTYAAVDVTGY